jgi:hypothetical protein
VRNGQGSTGILTDPHGILAWRTGNSFWRFVTTVHYHWFLTCIPTPYGCVQNGGYSWVIDSIDCAPEYAYAYVLTISRCDQWAISDNGWLGWTVGADFTVSLLTVAEGMKTRAFWWVVQVPGSDPPGNNNPFCCKTTSRWSS